MTKKLLLERINSPSFQFKKEELLTWIGCLPNIKMVHPKEYRIGDILMHPIFTHPMVLTRKRGDNYLCLMMTSNSIPNATIQAKSRFVDTYFCNIIMEVHISVIESSEFMGIYNNNKHLREVFTEIKLKLQ